MNRITFWLCAILLTTSLFSCKEKAGIETKIPKNASGVILINTSSVAQKVLLDKLGDITLDDFSRGDDDGGTTTDPMPLTDDEKWKDVMKDPSDVGIDVLADAFIYFSDEFNGSEPEQATALFKLSDSKKLEKFLNNNPPSSMKGETQSAGKFSFRNLTGNKAALGWNENTLALVVSNPSIDKRDFKKDLTAIFERKAGESMASDERFKELLDTDPDLGFSFNLNKWEKAISKSSPSTLWQEQWTDYVNAYIDFNDGEIKINTTQYIKKGKEDAYNKITDGVMMASMFDHFDIDNALGFVNFRFDPASFREMIDKDESSKRGLNSFLTGMNMTENEFFDLFSGGMMVSLTGVEMVETQEISYEQDEEFNTTEIVITTKKAQPQFVASIGMKKSNKLMTGINNAGITSMENGKYKLNPLATGFLKLKSDVYMWQADDQLILSSKPELDNENDNSGGIYDLATQNPISLFINADAIIDAMPDDEKKQFTPIFEDAKNTFSGIEMFVTPNSDGKVTTQLALKFDDDDANGLLELIAFFKRMETKRKQLTM